MTTERVIKARANKRKHTFTIRVYHNGKLSVKYRTVRQNNDDFNYYSNYATQRDWEQFLKTDEYYTVK